jgi:hypothetical protein
MLTVRVGKEHELDHERIAAMSAASAARRKGALESCIVRIVTETQANMVVPERDAAAALVVRPWLNPPDFVAMYRPFAAVIRPKRLDEDLNPAREYGGHASAISTYVHRIRQFDADGWKLLVDLAQEEARTPNDEAWAAFRTAMQAGKVSAEQGRLGRQTPSDLSDDVYDAVVDTALRLGVGIDDPAIDYVVDYLRLPALALVVQDVVSPVDFAHLFHEPLMSIIPPPSPR